MSSLCSLQKGLVLHLPLDIESLKSATVFADRTPYCNNGTSANTPVFTTDRMGQANRAMSFDGVSDVIQTSLNGFPDLMTEITVSFWGYSKENTGSNIIIRTNPDNNDNRINIHCPYYNTTIFWDFGNIVEGGRLSTSWNSSWYEGWAYWTFISGVGGHKIYRNNVLIASNTTYSTFTKGTKTLKIGTFEVSSSWNGSLAEARIYNRPLLTTERTQLYETYRPKILIG